MIFLRDVDPALWAKRHDLRTDVVFECPVCHKHFPVNIPILTTTAKGFHTGFHGCGQEHSRTLVSPRSIHHEGKRGTNEKNR